MLLAPVISGSSNKDNTNKNMATHRKTASFADDLLDSLPHFVEELPATPAMKEEIQEMAASTTPHLVAQIDFDLPASDPEMKEELQEAVMDVNPHLVTQIKGDLPATPAMKEELHDMVSEGVVGNPHHFVFAYGSLICGKSRAISAPTLADKDAIPVQVQDVERIWAKRTQRGMTAMGVRFRPGAVCTGVLLPVTEHELARFDAREVGYDRYPIPLDNVEEVPFLAKQNHYEEKDYEHADVVFDNDNNNDNDNTTNQTTTSNTTSSSEEGVSQPEVFVWVYVQRYDCPADEDFPIAQSYVDIILRGCMGISKEFARNFIKETKGWSPEEVYGEGNADDPINDSDDDDEDNSNSKNREGCKSSSNSVSNSGEEEGATWVDDREEPIYMRADPVYSEKKADVIDQLLEDHIPEHLDNREPVNDDDDDNDGGLA